MTGGTGGPEKTFDAPFERLLVDGQRVTDPLNRAVNRRIVVRVAHHQRRHEQAAHQGLAQKQRAKRLRRPAFGVARDVDQIARPSDDIEVSVEPGRCHDLSHAGRQTLSLPPQRLNDRLFPIGANHRAGRGEGSEARRHASWRAETRVDVYREGHRAP